LKIFYCYSPNLKSALVNKGINYLHKGINDRTNKTFWVFEGTQALNNFLDIWSSKKK
jgi:hypothetical protein